MRCLSQPTPQASEEQGDGGLADVLDASEGGGVRVGCWSVWWVR